MTSRPPTISAADFERALEVVRSADPHLRRRAAQHLHTAMTASVVAPVAVPPSAPRVRRMVVSSGTTSVPAAGEVRTRGVVEGESRADVEVRWAIEVIAAGLVGGATAAAAASDPAEAARLQLELVLSVLVAFAA